MELSSHGLIYISSTLQVRILCSFVSLLVLFIKPVPLAFRLLPDEL